MQSTFSLFRILNHHNYHSNSLNLFNSTSLKSLIFFSEGRVIPIPRYRPSDFIIFNLLRGIVK